jgi:hypothetical protein
VRQKERKRSTAKPAASVRISLVFGDGDVAARRDCDSGATCRSRVASGM